MKKKLILIGDSAFAQIAYEYFTYDSEYEVVAFAVEAEFRARNELFGLPVVDFETVHEKFLPDEHYVFAAVVYTQLNRLRARLMEEARERGYSLASYVSSKAFVWRNVNIGEHCFIFENNTLQPYVDIGDNVILWSGNHIGHHTTIRSHVFIASQVVISGFVDVGENSFLGVNSTVSNNVTIGRDSWIGPGALIVRDIESQSLHTTADAEQAKITTHRFFRIKG